MTFTERRAYQPHGVRERPLEFYVGFLVTFMGLYGFLDPNFPENLPPLQYWIITAEDVYLVTAGIGVMTSLILKQLRVHLAFAMVLEMFSWSFIAAAAAVIALTATWIPPTAIPLPNESLTIAWVFLWAGLAAAAVTRTVTIRRNIRRFGK